MRAIFAAALLATLACNVGAQSSIAVGKAKPLRKGVDALPMVAPEDTSAANRANATLTRLNDRMIRQLKECDADYLQSLKDLGAGAKGQRFVADDWTRTVEVTMAGPRYLSLLVTDEANCGGAHPNSGQMALVFDMTTGAELNWMRTIATQAHASTYADTRLDGGTLVALVIPELAKRYIAAADADCKDAFGEQLSFLLWPDAKDGTLVAEPFDLPHVVQACANPIGLSMADARKLGFGEDLLSMIEQAHGKELAKPQVSKN